MLKNRDKNFTTPTLKKLKNLHLSSDAPLSLWTFNGSSHNHGGGLHTNRSLLRADRSVAEGKKI